MTKSVHALCRFEQHFGVGMHCIGKSILRACFLNHTAKIEHANPADHMLYHSQIAAD